MTKLVIAGLPDRVIAGLTDDVIAGVHDHVIAGLTNRVIAGLTGNLCLWHIAVRTAGSHNEPVGIYLGVGGQHL